MKKLTLTTLLCVAVLASGVALYRSPAGTQTPARLQATITVEMGYLLYLPEDYDQQDSWPVILFLHGSGERGDNIDLVKVHGPPKLVAEGRDFPCIVVSPQCGIDDRWNAKELTALLDDVVSRYSVDEDRIYVTGLSMGGFGTWRLAAHAPQRFAAIAPICGGGEPRWAERIAHLPAWVFHGVRDEAVPVKHSQEMVDALAKNEGEPKLTIYPEAEHDSWTETYDNPEFYEWLFSQKRVAPPAD